ncbi:VOC family protein [Arenibaculum pallidiluteum]|uniref:VOC family protein n=1 Tax=Arenibaculum pallidiluteum TaxID=2812559 RepID=UPI001A97B48B|nr:VOC family protein [Arenibaculum pallidiluteum]
MVTDDLASMVVSMRPFVPAREFQASLGFYEALGFRSDRLGDRIALMRLGDGRGAFSFLLQDFYVKEFAENLMMHLMVEDLDRWWDHIAALGLDARFAVPAPRPPRKESWGLRVAYVWDPAGVLWHVASES